MRVITGKAKGRKLITVEGTEIVRPTLDSVKEAMFSAIQFEIEGANVLDLFAGSGQLGIEALSRGAKRAFFVDSAAESIKVVKQNVAWVKFEEYSEIVQKPFAAFLKTTSDIFDIAFLDPPYRMGLLGKALPLLEPRMSERGIIICEHENECALPKRLGRFEITKVLRHRGLDISIYRIPVTDEEDEI
ncbi:MAG: 16S rRNA (guanine(966)-N(2))-methyltransferase RsmD [Oscillospiraceae bacterium]|nr:16S rRNA (guanine(966)-N(2))-methyltransferase RsmD [Oscillospiraceae bacterium]